jgi:diguanylate cyclase (GGDEF)-like protein/PAS domain S-box-containing protein
VKLSGSLSGTALRSGKILASRDTETDERVDRSACRRVGLRSMIVVPLGSAGGVQGVLKVAWARTDGFNPHDEDLLALVTRAAAARLDLAASSAALAASERLFRTALDRAPIGTALLGLDGRWLQVNDALLRLVGYDQEGLLRRTFHDITHPQDLGGDLQLVEQLLRGEIPSYNVIKRFMHAHGHVVWVRLHASLLRDDTGEPLHYIVQIEDITALHSHQAELERLAVTDPLTGLANRAGLFLAAERAMNLDQPRPRAAAMLLLDLDHFKLVNDSLGHQAGDALLQAVAARLRDATRPGDVVARLGGDEFVVLLDGAPPPEEVDLVAARLVTTVARPFELGMHGSARCGCSVGIAYVAAGTSAEELYRRADLALYRAKDAGRGRYAHYDSSLHRDAEARLSSEQILRSSLEADGVDVHYQPIVDLHTGAVVGLEALARLRRSDLSPKTFIPVAEDTGLVAQLDGAVLEAVLDMTDHAPERLPDLRYVHVNVAPASLADRVWQRHADLERMTQGVTVSLEVTERTLLAGGSPAADSLRALSRAGVDVGLDDFGTGRASLAVLHEQPMDFLKVDRSFVARLAHDPRARALVHGIVVIAQELGLVVIAEGVENEQQLQAVRAAGCHLAQGFLLGRPGPVADLRPPPPELFADR